MSEVHREFLTVVPGRSVLVFGRLCFFNEHAFEIGRKLDVFVETSVIHGLDRLGVRVQPGEPLGFGVRRFAFRSSLKRPFKILLHFKLRGLDHLHGLRPDDFPSRTLLSKAGMN